MRVLHLSDRLTERGGAHQHLRSVMRAQVEAGHQVALAAGSADPGTHAPGGVAFHATPGLESRTETPVALDALVDAVAQDVLHVHTVMNPTALRVAAERGAIFTVQDHRAFCPSRGKWTAQGDVCRTAFSPSACAVCFDDEGYFDEMLDLTRIRLDALRGRTVVVLSAYMKAELVAAGLEGERVHVVPPFVDFDDTPRAETDAGPPCVLFAGRLVDAKGALDAVDAWRRSGVDLPLVVAGTGPRREALAAAGAQVLGWVPHAHLPALFRRARALLLPSRWQEPFGLAGLEALACGVPVAAWRSGGVEDWHPGPLAEWGDLDGLAARLREAVTERAALPEGFDRPRLMERLHAAYAAGARR